MKQREVITSCNKKHLFNEFISSKSTETSGSVQNSPEEEGDLSCMDSDSDKSEIVCFYQLINVHGLFFCFQPLFLGNIGLIWFEYIVFLLLKRLIKD